MPKDRQRPSCPGCLVEHRSLVIDSRTTARTIRRRRRCEGCGHRWTTYEIEGKDLKPVLDFVDRAEKAVDQMTVAAIALSNDVTKIRDVLRIPDDD